MVLDCYVLPRGFPDFWVFGCVVGMGFGMEVATLWLDCKGVRIDEFWSCGFRERVG